MLIALLLLIAQVQAQAQAQQPKELVLVKAAHLIDGRTDAARDGLAVLIEGDRIKRVGPPAQPAPRATRTIDLGNATLLPGLIDNHTHVLLQGDITAADYDEQLLKESTPYRTIRATVAARIALMNG